MKLAIVGSGMIVNDFLPSAKDVPGLTLSAVVGLPSERDKLEQLGRQHGIAQVYQDYDECLADPEVDTVWVAVPNSLHITFARQALLAGKHVICEKPFVLRVDDLVELRKLADDRDLILVEGITTLYLANYRWIVENLALLGDLRLVQSEYSQYSSRYPAFRDGQALPAFDPAMGGGALMDIGIYTLHFVVGLLGRPRSIRYTANIDRGVDTSGVVVMDYGDCTAICVCAKDSAGPIRSKIQGNDGTIIMEGSPNVCDSVTVQRRGKEPETIDLKVHPHRMVEEFRAFERMVRENDLAERDTRMDHSQLVLELAAKALASAEIRLGPA